MGGGGGGCLVAHFIDHGTNCWWVVSFMPQSLYSQGKSPWYPLDRRLGGLHSWSGWCGDEKILDRTGTQTPTPRSSSLYPVAIPTMISQLQAQGLIKKIDIYREKQSMVQYVVIDMGVCLVFCYFLSKLSYLYKYRYKFVLMKLAYLFILSDYHLR
jgi:hypothetical protein